MRVGHPADDFIPAEDVLRQLCGHQVHRVLLGHRRHGVAVLHAAPAQGVRVGGVAHKGSAVKGIIVKGIQTLELLRVLFHHRDIMADALQIADQRRTHLIAADHQYVHEGSPRCSQCFLRRAQKADRLLIFIV